MLAKRNLTFAIGLLLLACPFTLGQEKETKNKAANKKATVQSKSELVVGSDAPEWSLLGTDGKTYKLSEFKNKKPVVVFWYPMALTGG